MPVAVEFRSVHKRLGDRLALDGVDLQLRTGGLVTLLGPYWPRADRGRGYPPLALWALWPRAPPR